MEPPAGGRRHNRGYSSRSGTISVAELIRQQPSSVRIPSADQAATDGLVTDLLGSEPEPDYQEPRHSTAAKLIGMTIATVALCATVAAASMITSYRQQPTSAAVAATDAATPSAITGAGALRPDLLNTEVSGSSTPTTPARPSVQSVVTQPGSTGSTGTRQTGATGGGTTVATGGGQLRSAGTPTMTAQTPIDVVRQFYQLVAVDPQGALSLVGSTLGGLDPSGFVQSWNAVRTVRTEMVQAQSNNSVLGLIAIQQPDGSWLHVEQLLHLDDQAPPRIIGAEVLSAQKG